MVTGEWCDTGSLFEKVSGVEVSDIVVPCHVTTQTSSRRAAAIRS